MKNSDFTLVRDVVTFKVRDCFIFSSLDDQFSHLEDIYVLVEVTRVASESFSLEQSLSLLFVASIKCNPMFYSSFDSCRKCYQKNDDQSDFYRLNILRSFSVSDATYVKLP